MKNLIQNIPTHLFLGFLGVGKTSAILNCFKQKPNSEHWVVVVNEFGQQGIDGKLYADKRIRVKEVAGGCLCCVAGLPFQMAIMQILKEQKPDRLFIESSGASHAEGVIKTLQQDNFKSVLDLKAKICLIDPNHLCDKRYYKNINYQAQIQATDVLIVNKMDSASADALDQLKQLIDSFSPAKSFIQKTSYGHIDLQYLNAPLIYSSPSAVKFFTADNNPLNFKSFGWDFETNDFFKRSLLSEWMQNTHFIRAKAIVNTTEGWYSFNTVNTSTQCQPISSQSHARIEVISAKDSDFSLSQLQKQLTDYIKKT